MGFFDRNVRPVSHETIGNALGTGVVAAVIALYEPARESVMRALTFRVWLFWPLLAVAVALVAVIRLKKKVVKLERDIEVVSAQLEAKNTEKQIRNAQQNAERAARLNARRGGWIHGWRK